MAWTKKTWTSRVCTGGNKFIIGEKDVNGKQTIVNSPDSIIQQGDNLSDVNLNNLEDRIDSGFRDTQKNLALIETSPSTRAYKVDEKFIYKGELCQAVENIAVGDELIFSGIHMNIMHCYLANSMTVPQTNLYGYGFRLGNGIIINIMDKVGVGGSTTRDGSWWYSSDTTEYPFPIPFSSVPLVFGQCTANKWAVPAQIIATTDAITKIQFIRPDNNDIYAVAGDIKIIAFGM